MKLTRRPVCLGLLLLAGLAAVAGRSSRLTDYLTAQFAPASVEQSQYYTLPSESVIDGATLVVLDDGQEEKEVHLCGIATPEPATSKAHLRQLLSQSTDNRIILLAAESDRPGLMAEAFLPTDSPEPGLEIHLNTQMLLDGMAVVDDGSVDSCPNGSLYRAAEAEAKQQSIGVWSAPVSQRP
ncbi:MAG: hypothetical protein DCF25_15920 [Leptolyngbya foveolarum]|uniref:TNase-like domain-containing protein n=1 Tax=Leptolyngbya foveolarum TaxID=47253 RepID=A0A2W4TY28_9CYAN|nr:MAG: hypothetical protein DCF25_15920 [Leptolyngbya foveolarum]